ncbi:hypothetical protein SY86_12235 [Erwinia tracheiphila]|uniref:Uncharacterized protein n=1 Tax=Erwinia tracheiphila TaxID=65700 RepID=A0A0M2KGF1_9GAMM|nr:hypothetical protein AV903_15430 [Erwinia tracheiphila]KKF36016.1 hypothetical protein SY86_12235 [Erwinia tracheiphila]
MILIAYYCFSLILFITFYILKYKKIVVKKVSKIVLFFSICPFIIFQYIVFRYGIDWVSDLLGVISDDSIFLRVSALFFTASYLFFLPVRNFENVQEK